MNICYSHALKELELQASEYATGNHVTDPPATLITMNTIKIETKSQLYSNITQRVIFLCLVKMNFLTILVVFLLSIQSSISCNVTDCVLLSELECALYTTDSNEKKLNQAFFPPRKETSRYIRVIYDFKANPNSDYSDVFQQCNVTYVWAVGGFLLIQPPTIFQLTSLLFSYPANDIYDVHLTLPEQCLELVHYDPINKTCSCQAMEDQNLDILTQQVYVSVLQCAT